MAEILKTLIPGGGGDYTSMNTAEADNQQDLTDNGGDTFVLECYTGTDSIGVDWGGWITSVTNDITVRAASGEESNGVLNAGYVLAGRMRVVATIHLTFKDICFSLTNDIAVNLTAASGGTLTLERMVIVGESPNLNTISADNGAAGDLLVRNTLIHSVHRGCRYLEYLSSAVFQNVTSYSQAGIAIIMNGVQLTNCIGIGSQAFSGTAVSASHNASSDTTGPASDANLLTNVSLVPGVNFVDPAGGDFNIVPGGVLDGANNAGVDLGAQFTDDIVRNTRTPPWERGAFAIAGGQPPVGIQEMYIKDGGIFVKYTPYVKVGGTFQEVDAYVLEGGTWKPVHEK